MRSRSRIDVIDLIRAMAGYLSFVFVIVLSSFKFTLSFCTGGSCAGVAAGCVCGAS